MLIESVLYLCSLALLAVLATPPLKRRPAPDWLVRLRQRGRPGTLAVAWSAGAAGFFLPWLIGDERGLTALLAWLLHLGLPLGAYFLTRWWRTAAPE